MKFRKYFGVIAFVLIICTPGFLSLVSSATGTKFDTELEGFTDDVDQPKFTLKDFFSGEYQAQYSSWYDQNATGHAAMTKTYNSIKYDIFSVGNRPVGKDEFVYEPAYIEAELALGEANDFSLEANQEKLKDFVKSLESVNTKLDSIGKHLYVYIAPSKADYAPDSIPEKYKGIASADSINATDYFISLIDKTDIKYLLCSTLEKDLEYPGFYFTGIHWSRPYEQYASKVILNDLMELTGKNYRQFEFDGVTESKIPFNRDTDIYDLLNIWEKPDCTFYQYDCKPVYPENYDKLAIFLYGDSFAQGLRSDVFDMFPNESIYYVNYDNYILDYRNYIEIDHDYNNIDWQKCLDSSDVVVIEMNEALVKDCSTGFVPYLDAYLDTYVPHEIEHNYMDNLDTANLNWDYSEIFGIYSNEGYSAWTSRAFALELQNEDITNKGLEISFVVPQQVLDKYGSDTITLDVNGQCQKVNNYTTSDIQTVYFSPDEISSADDIYSISCYCSDFFNPSDEGFDDDRNLGVQITYIGARR